MGSSAANSELRMYALSWAIRSKPEWQRKIIDSVIMDKWRKEALDQQEALHINEKRTPNMINYVLTELAGYAKLSNPESGIENGPFDAIWFSDRLISNETSTLLRAAVTNLEDYLTWSIPRCAMGPIIYGRTRSGSTLLEPPKNDGSGHYASNALSSSFCWLLSDFSVDATNGAVTLVSSYINNLHLVMHKPLYCLIESVLTSFIPLFERVLSRVNGQDRDLYRDVTPGSGRIMVEWMFGTWSGYTMKLCGILVPCIWSKGEVKRSLREKAPKVLPEACTEYTGELEKMLVPYSLRGKTIQCIVKLANIHLTPENPEYKGGSWHVEGMVNEHIFASGIYYYEEESISESRLAFRVTTSPPVYHKQDDNMDSHCCQDLGSIAMSTGRALAWPNIYQHRVAPFHLVDPTKPRHRKILAIFLVNPSIDPIPSATTVPPQQADWVFAGLDEARADPASAFSRVPAEISNAIHEQFPDVFVARAEAEEYRLRLMNERTIFVKVHDRELSHSFNMCEH
ncbi:hypothetical protein B0H17DRAFT_1328251 [Mycena rosella]|uniref:Uncharacterized protein n=1 Tax=Mycena rosella TaxID=1033263 RepID=A0AAD7DTY4_MYCRO|nr:hypothetical protein B0H17DRAFT_1328251 [Mycena rosella]